MKTGIAISEQEYLTNPGYEHFEYVGGEVVEKPMGSTKHGRLQVRPCVLLNAFAERIGMQLATELHCLLSVGGETIYRLPDVSMIDESHINVRDHRVGGPAMAIEIRSPEEYFANGTKLVWIVEEGEELTGGPIWPDLRVDLEAAFKGI